jgi:hypothetical protein
VRIDVENFVAARQRHSRRLAAASGARVRVEQESEQCMVVLDIWIVRLNP